MICYYMRVSTMEQKIDRQLLAYSKADFQYIDKMSSRSRERLELQRLLDDLQAGDVVVVKSLDRLLRSIKGVKKGNRIARETVGGICLFV